MKHQIQWQEEVKRFPNRVQWDPERNYLLKRLEFGSMQLGVSAEYLELYDSGNKNITDITNMMQAAESNEEYYKDFLAKYREYQVSDSSTAKRLGIKTPTDKQQ